MSTAIRSASHEEEKKAAALHAVKFVHDGQVVGLGSGSTATHAIRFLGERVRAGLKIRAIATSARSEDLARQLGIRLTDFEHDPEIDVTIDGADEVDPSLCLIKGGGGALLREKIVASASRQVVIVADSSKLVSVLGKFPLPVEAVSFGQIPVAARIKALGAKVSLRTDAEGKPYLSDEGHHILDCHFGAIPDPQALALQLSGIPGLVEHGLFLNLASLVVVANAEEVREMRRG